MFSSESVERCRKIDAGGGLDDELNGLCALLVAKEAFEGALTCPAAVAVHDDRNVLGDLGWIKLAIEAQLLGKRSIR